MGIIQDDYYSRWIYSKRPIKNIRFYFISGQKDLSLLLKVNHQEKELQISGKNQVALVEFAQLKPKPLFYDYIYKLEIKAQNDYLMNPSGVFVWDPEYDESQDSSQHPYQEPSINLDSPPQGDIPMLFSSAEFPEWVRRVCYQWGIDLTLLAFLNSQTFNSTSNITNESFFQQIFPLGNGSYILKMETGDLPVSTQLEITQYTLKGSSQILEPLTANSLNDFSLTMKEPFGFVSFKIKPGRTFIKIKKSAIKQVILTPDYRRFVSSHMSAERPR